MVQSQDHHAAFFAAAFVACAAAVVVSVVHVASVVVVTDVVVVASVETSWALVAVSSGGFPFEKQDVASASAAAVASVVVVASVAVVEPFAVASVVASSALVVLAVVASFLAAAAVVAAAASLGCPVGAALVVLVLGTEAGFECHLEVGSLALMRDLAFSASEDSLDSVQLQRNLVGLGLPLLMKSRAPVVLAAWPL